MIKTKYYNDFIAYYDKAKVLQDRNVNLMPDQHHTIKCDDPLMDNITIYDTVNRKYAGFSKALEDVHGVRCRTHYHRYADFSQKLDIFEFHLIHLFHRFTGSGASFRPTFHKDGTRRDDEHGYHNNHVERLCHLTHEGDVADAIDYIIKCDKPMVTSIGNQPPSLKNKHPDKYRLAMQYYFDNHSVDFVCDYLSFLDDFKRHNKRPAGIKNAVDFSCHWHKDRGFKQWHFVLTAFVMDTAEYYPELVDRDSHCYYGANCIRGFKLMFQKEKIDGKIKTSEWYERCMTELVKARPTSKPYDMEDVVCDYIRYVVQYFPKGYEHLSIPESTNVSLLKLDSEYPDDVKETLTKIVGYYDYRSKAKKEEKKEKDVSSSKRATSEALQA